jgi:hypothetical protein
MHGLILPAIGRLLVSFRLRPLPCGMLVGFWSLAGRSGASNEVSSFETAVLNTIPEGFRPATTNPAIANSEIPFSALSGA